MRCVWRLRPLWLFIHMFPSFWLDLRQTGANHVKVANTNLRNLLPCGLKKECFTIFRVTVSFSLVSRNKAVVKVTLFKFRKFADSCEKCFDNISNSNHTLWKNYRESLLFKGRTQIDHSDSIPVQRSSDEWVVWRCKNIRHYARSTVRNQLCSNW